MHIQKNTPPNISKQLSDSIASLSVFLFWGVHVCMRISTSSMSRSYPARARLARGPRVSRALFFFCKNRNPRYGIYREDTQKKTHTPKMSGSKVLDIVVVTLSRPETVIRWMKDYFGIHIDRGHCMSPRDFPDLLQRDTSGWKRGKTPMLQTLRQKHGNGTDIVLVDGDADSIAQAADCGFYTVQVLAGCGMTNNTLLRIKTTIAELGERQYPCSYREGHPSTPRGVVLAVGFDCVMTRIDHEGAVPLDHVPRHSRVTRPHLVQSLFRLKGERFPVTHTGGAYYKKRKTTH